MKSNINILVSEDDTDINGLLCSILTRKGYNVRPTYSGSEAKMCLEQYDYDIVLLDLMLPGVSGEDLISEIRKLKIMPIIVISAKVAQQDKINVLKLGADDFIGKPFDVYEVLARVEAQLRRYKEFSNSNIKDKKLRYKNIILDTDAKEVFVRDKPIILTLTEYKILNLLMSNPKKVFTRANLFEAARNDKFIGDDNTINVHISNLRTKLSQADNNTKYIQTVWGIGFKLQE
ncbi:regulatory protein VanR [Clostridium pasteurianum DSM 525 = ATCC 6013]|uniref:Stage 0 sporulation protein A homolog n=1 Tax=Clostridium pasteurianum DSM 525 = ATCC 6013 TaxID=1262449 RepID=A0A0H3J5C8_CLOPA|nr:response regulator transcription factor [Clostridium pasteurianum]AJA47118.1 regulatory protein VanR [Clostridium pasteurianum DSM 525 = ATCC 6013]AJA51106.1 regulatory protein VanR [Clostridium pasteurianum DSM 525 = ATCC 6013]AOZ74480.1 XRE family transcriptional regulator [Clostridium pasteurianum DSM 525 = ATCC 6013]AOZ78277.1 XRE family transcriptional regulator [Clostridium pasteurianum]ELP59493.1 two component transcriptional regulator, winged helix family protein [Clostridium pasteu